MTPGVGASVRYRAAFVTYAVTLEGTFVEPHTPRKPAGR